MKITKELEDAYVQRMPKELKEKFFELSEIDREAIIKALIRWHRIIEEETFQLLSSVLNNKSEQNNST